MTVAESVRRAVGDPTAQCYVMAEAYYHLIGRRLGWRPWRGMGTTRASGTVVHWWLERAGRILDLSTKQFDGERFPYERGRRCGFLTRGPSKRARVIMRSARRLLVEATRRWLFGGPPKKVRVSVNGLKIRQNKRDGGNRRIFRKEYAGRVTYHNKLMIPKGAKLVYSPKRPLACGARAWIEWVEIA